MNEVCKREAVGNVHDGYHERMKPAENVLWSRIEKILDTRRWRPVDLCERAGITPQSIATFKNRAAKDPQATMQMPQIVRIARAADVTVDWLVGNDDTAGMYYEEDDPYPSRGQVIRIARSSGASEAALKELRREAFSEGDPGEAHWVKRLAQLVGTEREIKRILVDDEGAFDVREE